MQPLLAARALKSALVVAHAIRMPQRGRSNDASRGPRVSALRLPRGRQADGMQQKRCTSLSHHETRITKDLSECHAQDARFGRAHRQDKIGVCISDGFDVFYARRLTSDGNGIG